MLLLEEGEDARHVHDLLPKFLGPGDLLRGLDRRMLRIGIEVRDLEQVLRHRVEGLAVDLVKREGTIGRRDLLQQSEDRVCLLPADLDDFLHAVLPSLGFRCGPVPCPDSPTAGPGEG